jgi:hypothetical protein
VIGSRPGAALVRYNLLSVAVFAVASFGAYMLACQLGAGRVGAAIAASPAPAASGGIVTRSP